MTVKIHISIQEKTLKGLKKYKDTGVGVSTTINALAYRKMKRDGHIRVCKREKMIYIHLCRSDWNVLQECKNDIQTIPMSESVLVFLLQVCAIIIAMRPNTKSVTSVAFDYLLQYRVHKKCKSFIRYINLVGTLILWIILSLQT